MIAEAVVAGAPDPGDPQAMDADSQPRPPAGSELPDGPRSPEQVRRAQRLESLGRLAGGIAHDFNNVLGVILGYVELAKMNMQGVDPKALRHLDLALNTLGRARALSDRLLDFARETRRAPDVSDINETVQSVRELLAETLDRRIEFVANLGSGVPPGALDEDEMHQAVSNLCLNAAEAMPDGGTITLETGRERVETGDPAGLPPGLYASLHVRDTGPGIPSDLRQRIFDPYFTTQPHERSGLGLWAVRMLAERYGGHIEAGGDDQGATFHLRLPCELDVTPGQAVPGRAVLGQAAAAGAGSQASSDAPLDELIVDVLIVDDEPGVRDVIRGYLEMDGYRVLTAGTGAEAVELLREHAAGIRAVFLDHRMPDVQGADLAREIRQAPSAPSIVMTTGMAGEPEMADLPEGTRVLAKPFLHDDVTHLLRDDLGILPRDPA